MYKENGKLFISSLGTALKCVALIALIGVRSVAWLIFSLANALGMRMSRSGTIEVRK